VTIANKCYGPISKKQNYNSKGAILIKPFKHIISVLTINNE